jgi:hypothetical protein
MRAEIGVEWVMLSASAGAALVIMMLLRRRRAWLSGRRLEQHLMWRSATWRYWPVWLVAVIGFIGVIDGGPRLIEIAALLAFVVLWALSGVILYRERRLEGTAGDSGRRGGMGRRPGA